MKTTREVFVEAFENHITSLIKKQAKLILKINECKLAITRHYKDECNYSLSYEYDEEEGYSYTKLRPRKIGFIGGKK